MSVQAWQFQTIGEPLVLVDLPDPRPSTGQVVVATAATGFCHTDVGYQDGTLTSALPYIPIVLGHEIAGTIVEIGEGVEGFAIGQRVAIKSGPESPGNVSDGGFAPAVASPANILVPVPDAVSNAAAAISTDAGLTAYQALHGQGNVKAGDRVGIIGLGGLGYFGAQIARVAGAEVFVAEPNLAALENSREFGYAGYESDVDAYNGYDLDLVVDFAGFGTTTAGALNAVREGGKIVQIGVAKTQALISTLTLVARELTIVGSVGGTLSDLSAVLDLLATGDIVARTELVGFRDIADGLTRLAAGGLTSRLVATFE
jgi:2-desacetyl-2-hydroxyethyl bacteriochlorophyllide A dehydrogenase